MNDAQLGWAVGHDEVIIRTRDGGSTWQRVHDAPENEKPLLDVWFADAQTGLAVGAYGGLLATVDGGATWTSRTVHGEDDFHLNQIAAAADGTLYLAARGRAPLPVGRRRRVTWVTLPSPYDGSFFGLLPHAGRGAPRLRPARPPVPVGGRRAHVDADRTGTRRR